MNNKLIIAATTIFILASMIFLSVQENRKANLDTKNIWQIAFSDPKNDSLNFIIMNHSWSNQFHYQILEDKTVVTQADAIVNTGQTKTIPVSTTNTSGKKITIRVSTDGKDSKEIYKIF